MIKNIQKLKNFGIFQDCNNSDVKDFGQFNLIYGWNGSGKSTLSTLFESLEKKTKPDKFPLAEFIVNCESDIAITHNNLASSVLNIQTFNQSFIKENIDWDNSIKSILLVAKEKIDERKKLEYLKVEQQKDNEAHTKGQTDITKLETELSTFKTNSARRIKTSLQTIDTSDSYYLNYDRRKLENFINTNLSNVKTDLSLLSDADTIQVTNSAKPDKKAKVTFSQVALDSETLDKAKQRLDDLLKTSAVNNIIKRLETHADINKWVSDGLELHNQHETKKCEFCGNEISNQRIKEIEAHFSDEYKIFKTRLTSAEQWLEGRYVKLGNFPPESSVYEEFKADYNVKTSTLKTATDAVNEEIKKWSEVLKKKIDNPFDTSLSVDSISETSISAFNEAIKSVSDTITKHNNKTDNFETETNKSKKILELHYATTEVKDFDYFGKIKAISDKKILNNTLMNTIEEGKKEIQILENSLSNEGIGADQFNQSLHKFIGRSELSLKFNKDIKGYEIIRNNNGIHDSNLSEGEKTAIAFVYFITKLTANDNKINKTIVVVDDPVSSFDSNHLFHAYSFLRHQCKDTKQLFVLTHNFTYFKLVRDWFYGNNKNRQNRKSPKEPNAYFFIIESSASIPRESKLANASPSLVDYNSEYHYLFAKVFNFKENSKLDRDEAFLTANLSRKLLESFFSFKYPKSRADINQLLNDGLGGCIITTPEIKEKIYRFINKYSHSNVIEINEDSSENLMGESYNVIGDIFRWIEEVDNIHYNEMVNTISTK
jgi:wobble nucleotide-excising tRNase